MSSLAVKDHPGRLDKRPSRTRSPRHWPGWLTGWAFVLPAVALFAVMGVYTIGSGLALSFAKWNGFTPTWTWVGVQNYLDLLYADPVLAPELRRAGGHTLQVMIAVPLLTVAISLPLAVALNSIRRLRAILRSIYFLPYVTTGIAVYFAWRYVLEPDGAINTLLRSLGLGTLAQPQGFLGNPDTALPTLILILVWSAVPVATLLYLSGLQAIDPNLFEAAQIDGAAPRHVLRRVIWPLLRPITAAIVLLGVRDALHGFQIFLVMTRGGPGGHTDVLGLMAYRLAFFKGLAQTLGVSSALGWMLFAGAVLLALLNARMLRRVR
ncbi:sugar ABC transporter permease [Planotetraspora thailandica]|uniref:Sugar ABC transporter permease n=1 Tax=Planotetraspora thailandica TaxID=487172 RepID=A0A8J3XVR7_9ACTN|nr:sugar ABC transporter permease [Planotetraspora thailandica]GII56827.1 sugar ABC transporter permease [Planotetraspora thailandica]